MKYVYELYNKNDLVEYVGESINPKNRFKNHISSNQSHGNGLFYNRQDIKMRIVANFNNDKEAYQHQIKLQKQYGLKTDNEKRLINNINGGKASINKLIEHNRKSGHIDNLLKIVHSKEIRDKAGLKLRKKIIAEKNGIEIEFNSLKEAAIYLNCTSPNITHALKSSGQAKGYTFKYRSK